MKLSIMEKKYAFKIYDNDVVNTCYEFDTKEKAEKWQKDFINDMKKIGCYPIKGIRTKVEEL